MASTASEPAQDVTAVASRDVSLEVPRVQSPIPPLPRRNAVDTPEARMSQPLLNNEPKSPGGDQVKQGRPPTPRNGKLKQALSSIWQTRVEVWRFLSSKCKALSNLSNDQAYISLTIISFLLVVNNVGDVFSIERIGSSKGPVTRLIVPPAVILGFWLCIMLPWFGKNFRTIRQSLSQEKPKFFARIGVVTGTLLPVMICQFLYLPFKALPAVRHVQWTQTYNNTGGLTAPLVYFNARYRYVATFADPLLSVDSAGLQCTVTRKNGTIEPVGCTPDSQSSLTGFSFLVNLGDSITLGLSEELSVEVNITVNQPAFLQVNGGIIPLQYVFIDKIFSNNISEAFADDRYPVATQFPWESTRNVAASVEQVTVDDTVNALNLTDNRKYNLYNIIAAEPGFPDPLNPNTTCLGSNAPNIPCAVSLILQVSPNTLIGTIRQSEHGMDPVMILIEEGAIVGGVAFFAFFLSICEGKDESDEQDGGEGHDEPAV